MLGGITDIRSLIGGGGLPKVPRKPVKAVT